MLPARDSDARVMSITDPAPRPVTVGSAPVLTMISPRESANCSQLGASDIGFPIAPRSGPGVEVPGDKNFGFGLESADVIL